MPLREAARLLALEYGANYYLTRQRAGHTGRPQRQPEYILVLRHHNEVRRLVLHPLEYAVLARLSAGDTLAQALEGADDGRELAELLPGFLGRWLAEGALRWA